MLPLRLSWHVTIASVRAQAKVLRHMAVAQALRLYQHMVQRCCYTVCKHELRLGGLRSTQLTCSPLVWAQWSLRST